MNLDVTDMEMLAQLARQQREAAAKAQQEPSFLDVVYADVEKVAARLAAAGCSRFHDYECEFVAGQMRFWWKSTAARRWLLNPPKPDAEHGRPASRRFVPTREQEQSPHLTALFAMGASEEDVVEHLFKLDVTRTRHEFRWRELTSNPIAVVVRPAPVPADEAALRDARAELTLLLEAERISDETIAILNAQIERLRAALEEAQRPAPQASLLAAGLARIRAWWKRCR